ncbi:MAG: methyl-accepting chemotaxis protein [Bryobacteraceae bacterium]
MKHILAFVGMLVLVLVPLVAYVDACRHARAQLDEVLHRYNRKLDAGAQVELATTEMQGAQRGLMLAYAMKDPQASSQYTQLYADSGKKIDSLLGELEPLLASAAEREAANDIRRSRGIWEPRFQALVALCEQDKIDQAYKLRNENKVISAKMHAAAAALVKQQKKALDGAGASADAAASKATWTALSIALVSVVLTGMILIAVRGMFRRIRQMVEELDRGAGQVASASAQLSTSSQVVAQGARQQASSIQETSRSAGQITAMTRQNAGHSSHASQLMLRTADMIVEANRSLDRMQSSMNEINSSCEQVGRITKVVEEIAFQTNILALNAAVEAARAGEAGLGFAVVAEEVRSLAKRSANAAAETAGLIETSIGKSHDGRSHFETVAVAIAKVTAGAGEVGALVDRIKAGSEGQAQEVESIAHAIGGMETATESSTAAAEKTSAIGEAMNAQAESLGAIARKLRALVG